MSYREKVKKYSIENNIKARELADIAKISQQAISKFFKGGDVKANVIEAWAKKWPEMICYALDLRCDGVNFIREDEHKEYADRVELIERVRKIEETVKSIVESEESKKIIL